MSGGQPCRLADIRGLSPAQAARKESVSSGVELGTSLWSGRPRLSVAFPKKKNAALCSDYFFISPNII